MPGQGLEILHFRERNAALFCLASNGNGKWMFTLRLQGGRHAKKLFFSYTCSRHEIRHARLAFRDRARLVEHDEVCLASRLQSSRRLEENAVLRSLAAADHDGDRSSKS